MAGIGQFLVAQFSGILIGVVIGFGGCWYLVKYRGWFKS